MAKSKMSDDHKAALAKGRTQGKAVRDYLAAMEESSKPGRRLSPDEITTKISDLHAAITTEADPSKRVELIQRRLDYEDRLARTGEQVDVEALEAAFVAAAQEYSERKGISYSAWREVGVSAATLKAAGVPRTRRTT